MKIIAAIDRENGIAKNGKIPWHISNDLKHFKKITIGNDIIVGSRTFEQLVEPLKDRHSIVISKNKKFKDVTTMSSLQLAMQIYPDAWVVGGAQIYAHTIPQVSELYITHLLEDYKCDVFFPDFLSDFVQTSKSEIITSNEINYYYAQYKRR